MPSAIALVKRRDALKSQASNHMTIWQDIADVTDPVKSNIIVQREDGAKQTDSIFDATAIHAKNLLRTTLHGNLTPRTQPWLSLKLRQEELNDNQEITEWLEDCSRRMHLSLRQSNFTTSVDEMYDDLVTFGTGCLFCEEEELEASGRFPGLRFEAVGVAHFFIGEDRRGRVDTIFRDFKLAARVIMDRWKDKVPDSFAAKCKTKPDDLFEIVHAVMPRQDLRYVNEGGSVQRAKGSKNMPFASYYILNESQKTLLEEGGFEEFPFMVPRWNKTPGEVFGRGPCHTGLPDIKSTQVMMEQVLKAVPLAIIPPILTRSESVVGDIDRSPGAHIEVDTMGGPLGDAIGPLNTGYKPDVAEAFFQRMDAKIQQYFFVDQLILREAPDMTATEIMARQEQNQRLLGPVTGRLEAEFLNPLVERIFGLMARVPGALLPIPDALQVLGAAADIDVEYEGPLALAQRNIEVQAQDILLQMVAGISTGLATYAPDLAREVWDPLKLDRFIKTRAEIKGVRTDDMNSDQEIAEIRGKRAEVQAAQQKKQEALQMTEAVKNVTPALSALQKPPQASGKAA